jgi:peroxiredoxin
VFGLAACQMTVKAGDTFPDVSVDYNFPPTKVSMKERLAGKKTLVVSLPGAFTPT